MELQSRKKTAPNWKQMCAQAKFNFKLFRIYFCSIICFGQLLGTILLCDFSYDGHIIHGLCFVQRKQQSTYTTEPLTCWKWVLIRLRNFPRNDNKFKSPFCCKHFFPLNLITLTTCLVRMCSDCFVPYITCYCAQSTMYRKCHHKRIKLIASDELLENIEFIYRYVCVCLGDKVY